MRRRFYWTYFPWLACIILAIFWISRNAVYQFFNPQAPALWTGQRDFIQFEIKALEEVTPRSKWILPFKLNPIKISIPFTEMRPGCEWFYGRVEKHSDRVFINEAQNPMKDDSWIDRYIIRFQYDHRNRRCESKDLWVDHRMGNQHFALQIVQVTVTPDELRESPWGPLFRIQIERTGNTLQAHFKDVKAEAEEHRWGPLRQIQVTPRRSLFSSPDLSGISYAVAPWNSLKDRLLEEIETRMARCLKGDCLPIRISVAAIEDPALEALLHRAQLTGLNIEVLTNVRLEHPLRRKARESFVPWQWSMGSSWKDYALLPLHSKFAIFGNELVLSTSSNFEFERFYRSREWFVAYTQPSIVQMFQNIQFFNRTNLFFPLQVDLRHPFLLLYNSDRSRLFSSSYRKAYSLVTTEGGVRSSAYGIALELIRRDPGPVQLWMSPISDSCYLYRSPLCFFEVLREKAFGPGLELHLNSFFYLPPHQTTTERLERQSAFLKDEQQKFLYQFQGEALSSRHERLILLSERVMLGSANFAHRSSVNTIEVFKDAHLRQKVLRERSTFLDPYTVMTARSSTPDQRRLGECEFVFERELGGKQYRSGYRWRRKDLEAALKADLSRTKIWIPLDDKNGKSSYSSLPISDEFETPAQSFCIELTHPTNRTDRWLAFYAPAFEVSPIEK